MIYTVLVTVKIAADTRNEAYRFIRHALDNARKAEIVHVDSEVIAECDDAPSAND